MKQFLLLLFLSCSAACFSQQTCDLEKSFDSVRVFMKENYAGYADKVSPARQKEFDQYTTRHIQLLKKVKTDAQYFHIVESWMHFFKDEHVSITVPFDTANGKLAQLIANTEQKKLLPEQLSKLEQADPSAIEGIYFTADTSYKVAVIKSDNGFRRYAGIIISSKAREWKAGDVKFELYPAHDRSYDVIWYNKLHQPVFSRLNFEKANPFSAQGWYKSGYKKDQPGAAKPYVPPYPEENTHVAFFKQIDVETGYLRIASFDASYIGMIDSVVKANQSLLEKLPNLVIDIRGNGGGADIAYRPLKQLMYTDPVKSIGVDLLATKYNIDITIELINSIAGIPEEDKKEYNEILARARGSKTRMFNFFPDKTDTLTALPYPKKIAILINGRCASTAEQFLLEAKQSKKVKLFGSPTMGVLDYANVREKKFSCPAFAVSYPSTRSRRVDIGQGIDNVGIMPDVPMDYSKDNWLKEVVGTLKK